MLTARHGTDATAEGLAAGADDYITKPFRTRNCWPGSAPTTSWSSCGNPPSTRPSQRADQFREALDSNRVIGTAVGIMMAFHRLTATQGFKLLVAASQHTNRKLRDLAAEVVAGGGLPIPADPGRRTAAPHRFRRPTGHPVAGRVRLGRVEAASAGAAFHRGPGPADRSLTWSVAFSASYRTVSAAPLAVDLTSSSACAAGSSKLSAPSFAASPSSFRW